MDPVVMGRPVLAVSFTMLVLGFILLPFADKGSAEFYVTIFGIGLNLFFVILLIKWIKKHTAKTDV